MTETRKAATRPVGNAQIQRDGSIVAEGPMSPESFIVGAEIWIPPRKVIPVLFLPGIMGSNLKVKPGSEEIVNKRMGGPKGSKIPDPWRPPNGKLEGLGEVRAWQGRTPRVRQSLLSGDTTVVDDSGFLNTQMGGFPLSNLTSLNNEEARFRGWGTVHWDSYGEFLLYLEQELRNLQDPRMFMNSQTSVATLDDPQMHACAEWWPLLYAGEPKKSSAPAAFKVSTGDLKKMSKFWFPVYACGYNWINSCAESGQRVLDTIEKIIEVYTGLKGPSGKQLFECEKVILVTHSMGGLVGRWAAKYDDNMRILGVVHGVQPAIGAPLAYRRAVAGTEPGGTLQTLFATIIGDNQAKTTPVVCNSAGSLQLLPTKLYPKGWLKLERDESTTAQKNIRTMESLPKSDPYEEIYSQQHAWWRLADPILLDPAGRFTSKNIDPWEKGYLEFLKQAESFHNRLEDYYHPNTYVCYGDDPDYVSFGSVRWRVELPSLRTIRMSDSEIIASQQPTVEVPPELMPSNNMNSESIKKASTEILLKGRRLLHVFPTETERYKWNSAIREAVIQHEDSRDGRKVKADYMIANIQPPDAPGDGTVPWQSGEAPGKASPKGRTFAIKGYDHQGCYNHQGPRRFSLWAVARMVREIV